MLQSQQLNTIVHIVEANMAIERYLFGPVYQLQVRAESNPSPNIQTIQEHFFIFT
jgi:hypothetical protein